MYEDIHLNTMGALVAWLEAEVLKDFDHRWALDERHERVSCDATADSPCDYWQDAHTDWRGEPVEAECGGHPLSRWYLMRRVHSWRSQTVYIPAEAGALLDTTWKRGKWDHRIGLRGPKRLLKDLGALSPQLAKRTKAAAKVTKLERKLRKCKGKVRRIDEILAKDGEWLSEQVCVALQQDAANWQGTAEHARKQLAKQEAIRDEA